MIRVFHVISHFGLGGAERVAANIAQKGSNEIEYHMVSVIGGNDSYHDSFCQELNNSQIIIHEGPKVCNRLGIVLFPFWFFVLFLKWHPNIIHTHTEIPDLSVYLFYLLGGHFFKSLRFIRTIHNTRLWSGWPYIGEQVERFYQSKKANVAISKSVQKSYFDRYSEQPPIIYNGLGTTIQKRFPGIDDSKINILFAGRFEWQKGIDELIDVVRNYSDDSRYLFHISGSGSLQKKIVDCIGDQPNVILYEPIFSIASFLDSFDYLFMPSNHEGLGLLSIEASFAKTPPIINGCAGLNETLPSDWPLKVNNNNVQDYFRIFNNLDKIDSNELGCRAYEFVDTMFRVEKMSMEYEYLYKA